MPRTTHRRTFLKTAAVSAAAGAIAPSLLTTPVRAADGDLLTTAAIGVGGRGSGIGGALRGRSNMIACCDVDRGHAERFSGGRLQIEEDYRKLLDRKDIQAVTIGTPDHWHTPIVLYALRAGKDVYCEKPLTLTIDEGKMLCRAVKETGRILQVGTQQRTEYGRNFLRAVVLARSGLIGKVTRVTAAIGGAPGGGESSIENPPESLNWDFWLGQTPVVPYQRTRCHGSFRWWYEYSGGKMTDWGAHHVDIAQWAIGMENSGPVKVQPVEFQHPVELVDGFPAQTDRYNTATQFAIRCMFAGDVELIVASGGRNGVLIEAEKGNVFVSRGGIMGGVLDDIRGDAASNEKLEQGVIDLFAGRPPKGHMDNFLDAVADRKQPISDVFTHHRALTTCHLCNIAIRLGRTIEWDATTEQAIGEDAAALNESWLKRPHRQGYAFS